MEQLSFKRYCKTLKLKNVPQLIEEYKLVHKQIWPEIAQGMKEVGIVDMEIYVQGTALFMIMETVPDFDHDKAMTLLSTKPRQAEWEAFVSKFQETSADKTADEKWILMERIFKLKE